MAEEKTLTCTLCEAMCGLVATVEDNQVVRLRPDSKDPLSRGAICPKGMALDELHRDPDRLRQPLIRRNGKLAPASWEEALDLCAERLAEVREKHGRHAVGLYFGNPLAHNTGGILFSSVFARKLRSRNNFSATSLDQLPHMLASYSMFGHQLMLPVPDVDRTEYMVVAGANPLVSNGSLMSAPGIRDRFSALSKRGDLVVVDPRKTETAKLATEHHYVRPGTDAWWLSALARTLFEEEGIQLGPLTKHTERIEAVKEAIREITPEWAEAESGVGAQAIRAMAKSLKEKRGVLYGRMGICTQAFGGLCAWLINVINLISGNLDAVGGAMFTTPAIDALAVASRLGRTGSFQQKTESARGLPRFAGELPTASMADEMLRKDEPMRALITAAGNPVLSAPNGRRIESALSKLDFMMSIDPYLNETTQHAHVVLPPRSNLERMHYDLVFHTLAVRNTAKYCPPLLQPEDGQLDDGQIFIELKTRLDRKEGTPLRSRFERWLWRGKGPERLLDLGLRLGPYRLSLNKLKQNPSGIDLGPLQSGQLPKRLYTPSKTIQVSQSYYVEDVQRLKSGAAHRTKNEPAGESRQPLHLIGRRELRSNNSWMHNMKSLMAGKARGTLHIHPADAMRLGLSDVEQAIMTSEAGSIRVQLSITENIMPGVVSLPHGYGHQREGTRLSIASQSSTMSVNDINEDGRIDELTGNAAFSGQPVTLKRA